MQPSVRISFTQWLKSRASFATTMLCALVLLAACGGDSGTSSNGDDDGRVFVTDRLPTTTATATEVTSTEVVTEVPTAVPTVSPSELLKVRGAPQLIYLVIDDVLTAYDSNMRTFTPIEMPDGFTMLEFSSSPTGDRVGILGVQDEVYTVLFSGADGQPLGEPISLKVKSTPPAQASPVASPAATPVSSGSSTLTIDWVPQGNGVLVSGPGVLQRVSMSGSIMPVSRAGATGTVINALWSPMDSQVVVKTQQMNGHQAVFVMNSGSDEVSELDVLHDAAGPSITNLQWLPTGLGLVMVAGSVDDGAVMNGQLYVYKFGEPVPKLVATSAQGGPTATISDAVVSPDGRSVAYAIMVRDLDEWHLHSLWVKPIAGGPAISIPITNSTPITGLVWSAEGLVWQQEDGNQYVVDGSLAPRPLGEEPVATPVASPGASPVASPVLEPTPRG